MELLQYYNGSSVAIGISADRKKFSAKPYITVYKILTVLIHYYSTTLIL